MRSMPPSPGAAAVSTRTPSGRTPISTGGPSQPRRTDHPDSVSEVSVTAGQGQIALVLRLQRPEKTSRTSSKPPSTDRKERRERSRPGGAKPGHEGRSRPLNDEG